MIFLRLAIEFFKIGLFSFGGGYATVPFLYHIAEVYGWYSIDELKQMVAVSAITPGPVGLNVATYAGIKTAGILGAVSATVSEVLPSFFMVIILSKLLKKYSSNFYVRAAIETLKPISAALLLSVATGFLIPSLKDTSALILLGLLLLLSWRSKKDPIFYMFIAAVIGAIKTLFI